MTAFDPRRMRHCAKNRPPFPGTTVLVTGTIKDGCTGLVVEKDPSWGWGEKAIAVEIGGVVFRFWHFQLIEVLSRQNAA